jgi:la-related protein 1
MTTMASLELCQCNCKFGVFILTLTRLTSFSEYYFSLDNLLRDMYLRKHMDSQGFVLLDFIAQFKRLQSLTQDLEMLKLVCQQSNTIEYRMGIDGKSRIRKAEGWKDWVLEKPIRDPTAQHDGIEAAQNTMPQYPGMMEQQMYASRHASLPQPLGSPNYGQYANGQIYNQQYFSPTHGEPSGQRFQTSPPPLNHSYANNHPANNNQMTNGAPLHNGATTNGTSHQEPDVVSDSQAEKLIIMTREPENQASDAAKATGEPQQQSSKASESSQHINGSLNSHE